MLTILLFCSLIQITNAIPVPVLVIWGDFILLAIPFILTISYTIYFYFRKYIFWINIYLFLLSIFLYFIHFYITDEIFINNYEYLYFLLILILFLFIYKTFKFNFLNYILIFLLIWINFFLIKIDYNLYEFKQLYSKIENNMYSNIKITKVIYKDNFTSIYTYDKETNLESYVVVWIWNQVSHCTKKWKYNVCTWGDRNLWKILSKLVYSFIK